MATDIPYRLLPSALACLRMGSQRTMGNTRDAYEQNAMRHSPSAARLSMSKKNRMRDSRAPASAVDTPLSSWRNVMWSLPSLQRCNVQDERLQRTQPVGAVGERDVRDRNLKRQNIRRITRLSRTCRCVLQMCPNLLQLRRTERSYAADDRWSGRCRAFHSGDRRALHRATAGPAHSRSIKPAVQALVASRGP